MFCKNPGSAPSYCTSVLLVANSKCSHQFLKEQFIFYPTKINQNVSTFAPIFICPKYSEYLIHTRILVIGESLFTIFASLT